MQWAFIYNGKKRPLLLQNYFTSGQSTQYVQIVDATPEEALKYEG